MGLFNGKDKNGNLKIQMVHIDGLPEYKRDSIIFLTIDASSRKITFKGTLKSNTEINLPIDKITGIGSVSEEIVKENLGVGRAIAGGLLFGGAGAVVGAVTAKDKKKNIYFKAINYRTDNGEKSIVLNTRADINETKFWKQLNELIPKKPSSIDL